MHLLSPAAEVDDLLELYRVERGRVDGRPWVMANMVASLDGSAAIGGRVGELSDDVDARLFRSMRALADVVLVGAETARREGYGPVQLSDELQARRSTDGMAPTPPLAVVSRSLRLDWGSRLFTASGEHPRPIIVTSGAADPDLLAEASERAEVIVAGDATVDLPDALAQLAERHDADVVLCEGGPSLLGQVAAEGLLDELCLTVSPLMGGDPLPVAVTPAGGGVSTFTLRQVAQAGESLYLRYHACR